LLKIALNTASPRGVWQPHETGQNSICARPLTESSERCTLPFASWSHEKVTQPAKTLQCRSARRQGAPPHSWNGPLRRCTRRCARDHTPSNPGVFGLARDSLITEASIAVGYSGCVVTSAATCAFWIKGTWVQKWHVMAWHGTVEYAQVDPAHLNPISSPDSMLFPVTARPHLSSILSASRSIYHNERPSQSHQDHISSSSDSP
jgi:hypothetical protein